MMMVLVCFGQAKAYSVMSCDNQSMQAAAMMNMDHSNHDMSMQNDNMVSDIASDCCEECSCVVSSCYSNVYLSEYNSFNSGIFTDNKPIVSSINIKSSVISLLFRPPII